MALKTVSGSAWFGYCDSSSSTPESRNGVLIFTQDSVVINESNRQGNKLGEGTFAKVYIGMHMGKERAIKVFHLDPTLDMALEECKKLNSLRHPNIVRVYGIWKDPHKGRNAPAIVMELCDHSLHDYVEQYYPRGSITREHKLKILYDITCAMVFLHSKNVVHGDLRTSNVLVNSKGINDEVTAKLTAFGMARVLDPQHNYHVTKSAADVDYLPPEVFNHKHQKNPKKNWAKLTTQVDVFMFGPVAIELACGEFPKPAPKQEVRKGKVTRTYDEIERREQHLTKVKTSDRAITEVIIKACLAENPEDRGTFLDLQRIVRSFQWQNNQPDNFQELFGQAQEELEGMRSQLEADQKSLYQQDLEEILKDEKKQLQDAYGDLKDDNNTLKVQLKEKVEEIAASQQKFEVTVTQLNEVKEKQDRTQSELEMRKDAWQTLQREYIKKLESHTNLNQDYDKLKANAEQECKTKDNAIDSWKQKCETTQTQLTVQISKLEHERDQVRSELEIQTTEQKTLHEEYTEKVATLADLTEKHQRCTEDYKTLVLDHRKMTEEHRKLIEKNNTLELDHRRMKEEYTEEKDHIKQLKDTVQLGNDERTRLVQRLRAEKATCTQTEAELEKLKHESQKKHEEITRVLRQKCEDTEAQLTVKLSQVEAQRDLAQRKLGHLEQASENKRKDFQVKLQAFEGRRKQFDKLKQDHSTLEFKLQMTQSAYEKEQKNCDRERDTTKGLRTEIAQLKGSFFSLDADFKECSVTKAELGEQLCEVQDKLKTLESAKKELQDNYDKVLQQHKELQRQFEALKIQSVHTEKVLKIATRELERSECSLQKQLNDLKKSHVSEIETQKGRVKTLQGEKQSLEAQTNYLKDTLKTFAEHKEKAVKALAHSEKERIDLTQKLTSSSAKVQASRCECDALQCCVHRLNTVIEKLTSVKQVLENNLAESQESEKKLKTTKMDLGDRLESLELKLRLKEEEVTELRATIERNEVRIQDAKEALSDFEKYRKTAQELRNQLREADTKASNYMSLCQEMGEENKRLEEEISTLEDALSKDGQSRMLAETLESVKSELSEQISTLKNETIARKNKEIDELKRTYAGNNDQKEAELQSSNGRISELERDIDASKAHSAELQSELNHTSTELTSTRAELNNTHDGLKKAQEQNEASSSRYQELEQQCQELRQHIAELESAQNRLQKREEDLNQQVEVLKSERDTAQRQAQDFDRDGRNWKLKLQKAQSDCKNEQDNCDRERDTTQGLRTEISQLIDRISSLEREVQALKEKGRHRREVMQQVVKVLQTQVAAVRSDLDQERSRQSELKDSVEQLLTRSFIVRSLKTELVSRAAELRKCRDELKTTTAERDRLNQSETSAASQVSVQQQLHQFQEHVTQSLGQVHDRVAKVAADMSAVPELNRGVQQLHRQMSSSSSLDQSSMSGQQLTSRSQKLESAIDSEEHLDPDLMTSDASSDVPITGQQRTLSSARLQPTPEEDPGLETVTSIALDLPDNGNGHHQLSPDSSPSSVDPHTTEVTTSPTEERDLVADLSRPTGPDHEMRTNSPDISRMGHQPAISHYRQPSARDRRQPSASDRHQPSASDRHQPSASDRRQPSASDRHQPSVRNRHQPSVSDRHQPSVNDHDLQSFRDHPPRPWSEDNMDPLLINAPNPSLPTRIAGQRRPFSNVASYSAFPFQNNPMSFGGFHLVPVPISFPTTSVMPIHDDPSPMSLPSSSQSGSSFPMHGGHDSSLSATVATSLQDSVDPALLKKRITKLSELMPYVPDLAHKVPQIAGYLDMYTKLQALKQTCSDPEIHLQELLSQWLEGQEDEERPHYWKYFITLVKAVDQYPVVRRIYIDLAAGQAKS